MQNFVAPEAVELSTPPRRNDAHHRILSLSRRTSTNAKGADEGDVGGIEISSDIEDSPHLPEDWQPLEYELLEYADLLPRKFTDRMCCELEVQEQRVAQLRGLNEMLRMALCNGPESVPKEPPEPTIDPVCDTSPSCSITSAANESITTPPAMSNTGRRHISMVQGRKIFKGAKGIRAAAISQTNPSITESELQFAENVRQIRRSAEQELLKLARRAKAAEQRQRELACEASENISSRRQLWEAEAELLRLRCRVQQLENARWHAERRATQHDNAEQQFAIDLAYLQAEVRGFRARKPKLDALEQREQELKHALRKAKTALRATRWRQMMSN